MFDKHADEAIEAGIWLKAEAKGRAKKVLFEAKNRSALKTKPQTSGKLSSFERIMFQRN